MSEEPCRKSHAWVWVLSILGAILILYVLSMPWVEMRYMGPWTVTGKDFKLPPQWEAWEAPYEWLIRHTPLPHPLQKYWRWCQMHRDLMPK